MLGRSGSVKRVIVSGEKNIGQKQILATFAIAWEHIIFNNDHTSFFSAYDGLGKSFIRLSNSGQLNWQTYLNGTLKIAGLWVRQEQWLKEL